MLNRNLETQSLQYSDKDIWDAVVRAAESTPYPVFGPRGRALRFIILPLMGEVIRRGMADSHTGKICPSHVGFFSRTYQIREKIRTAKEIRKFTQRNAGADILCPIATTDRLASTLSEIKSEKTIHLASIAGQVLHQWSKKLVSKSRVAWGVTEAVCESLASQGILLPEVSQAKLLDRVELFLRYRLCAEVLLSELSPKLILVYADNHAPCGPFVEVASEYGIPSLMVQHGLDCECYVLDDAHADHIAVWGGERKSRYEKHSEFSSDIRVTGNPEYDALREPATIDTGGKYVLFATRPHSEDKCYFPSRSPDEGVEILASIITGMLRTGLDTLVIKPHPYDEIARYDKILEKARNGGMAVIVSQQKLCELMLFSKFVICEDSTALLEAMIFGKMVIHVHFAKTEPVLKAAEYDAALSARNHDELVGCIAQIAHSQIDVNKMHQDQCKFIGDYAGKLDGYSAKRVAEFARNLL